MELEDLDFVPDRGGDSQYPWSKFLPTDSLRVHGFFNGSIFGRYPGKVIFTHFSLMRRVWEYLIILLSILVPMEIVFVVLVCPDISMRIYWISFLSDFCFLLDNFIIRRTSHMFEMKVLKKPKSITKAYGKVPMILHTISIIPLSWIGLIAGNKWLYLALSSNRVLRLLRGFRALRNVTKMLPYAGGSLSILPHLYLVIISIHTFSCILLGAASLRGYENSFLTPFYQSGYTTTQLYFVSVYFVMTTTMTIGYGDVVPVATVEVVITIFIQLVGVSIHTVFTSYLVAILIDPDKTDYIEHYKILQSYMRFWKVDEETHRAVREYCQYQWERTKGTGNTKRILSSLPASIRNGITLEMTRHFFEKTDTFTSLALRQLVRVTDQMTFKRYSPGDVISEQGNEADRMFFFKSGIIALVLDGRTVATEVCTLDKNVQGEHEMLVGGVNAMTTKAVTYVECWMYRFEDLVLLLRKSATMRMLVLDRLQITKPDSFQHIMNRIVPDLHMRQEYMEMIRRRELAAE